MYEDAQEIFDYLPIRRNTVENDYIDHLWQAFSALDQAGISARPFAIMPFHLLFMFAVQYKVLRIYKEIPGKYTLALTISPKAEDVGILTPESATTIAYFKEAEIIALLKIAGLSDENVKQIKNNVIKYRNDKVAHAKGYIERDIETKLNEYFGWLEKLQTAYQPMNQKVAARWIEEIGEGDDMQQFLETHFLDSCFSPCDFGSIVGELLESEKLDFEQWDQIVKKGLELAYDETIFTLRDIAKNESDDGRRFNAIRILQENGEIDKNFKKILSKSEKDKEIIEFMEQI